MKTTISAAVRNTVAPTTALALLFSCPIPGYAAAPNFQAFLFSACENAAGELGRRCNESINGDLSGDSEDSLNPTQNLSFNAMAIDETRARINALQSKLRQEREQGPEGHLADEEQSAEQSAMRVFRLTGTSGLIQGEFSELDRSASENERGYQSDTNKLQVGFDYRLADNWLIGAMLSLEEAETTFDADSIGVNFEPASTDGSSDADSVSLTIFTNKYLTSNIYIESLASYGVSEYTFKRRGIFQESTRDLSFNRAVTTSANADGYQLALSAGLGLDSSLGPLAVNYYINLNHQKSSIDSYNEKGGQGFGMAVDKVDSQYTIGTLGARFSMPFNTQAGVWVPKVFLEVEQVLDDDQVQTTSRFLEDQSGTALNLTGDKIDKTRWRTGFSLLTVQPNGWMGFISFSSVQGDSLKDEHSIQAGLRVEF
ncbi:MAG: autotransporter outer membrane beta-barrel domain-containing protein [Halioglobus sp.]